VGYENVAIFDQYLAISEMVEDRWVHAAMRLTSIESTFHPCDDVKFTAILPGAYPGEA